MPTYPIVDLDFFSVREQLKTYLSSQTKFKDYDFEGSNLSVLLDILAYNTYQNNFMANMIFAESFLDSAALPESIMSHAKSLNYLPRSAKSAVAVVDVIIASNTNEASFIIPADTRFVASVNGSSFSFYTNTGHIALREAGSNRYKATCVQLFEGILVEERFTVPTSGFEGLELMNDFIDSSSIRVRNLSTNQEYFFHSDIFGVEPTAQVFYLEPTRDAYKVVFGNDKFGRQPTSGEVFSVTYRITSGSAANGVNKFSTTVFPATTVVVRAPSVGGAAKESLESIRFFAPKSVQVQERAVTRKDYEILLKQRFVEILDVSVYDGAVLEPPQHGKVAISLNVAGGISTALRSAFISYLSDKTPLAIQPIFIEADYLYLAPTITLRVDDNIRNKSSGELKQLVADEVMNYNSVSLEKFSSVFRDSRLTEALNDLDRCILSASVEVAPYMEYSPQVGVGYSPTFKFETALVKPYPFSVSAGLADYIPAVKGATFVYDGIRSFFQDDGRGRIQVVSSDVSNTTIVAPNIGTVNYSTGEIRLSNFIVDSYEGSAIKISTTQLAEDVESPRNRVLKIRASDIVVNVISA